MGSCRGKPGPQSHLTQVPSVRSSDRSSVTYWEGGPHTPTLRLPPLSFPPGVCVLGSAHVVIARPDPGQRTSTIALPCEARPPQVWCPRYLAFAPFFSCKKSINYREKNRKIKQVQNSQMDKEYKQNVIPGLRNPDLEFLCSNQKTFEKYLQIGLQNQCIATKSITQ